MAGMAGASGLTAAGVLGMVLVGLAGGAPGLAEEPRVAGAGGAHVGGIAWVCLKVEQACAFATQLELPQCRLLPSFVPGGPTVVGGHVLGHVGPGRLYTVTEFVLGFDGGHDVRGGTLAGMFCKLESGWDLILHGEGVFVEDPRP